MKKNIITLIIIVTLVGSAHSSWFDDVKNFFYKKETASVASSS